MAEITRGCGWPGALRCVSQADATVNVELRVWFIVYGGYCGWIAHWASKFNMLKGLPIVFCGGDGNSDLIRVGGTACERVQVQSLEDLLPLPTGAKVHCGNTYACASQE
jgi:hypothetical protein